MSVRIGIVRTIPKWESADKAQVLKVGEEAMEVFSAWEDLESAEQTELDRGNLDYWKECLVDECADLITATCNLLAGLGVRDMAEAMERCERRNVERGRLAKRPTGKAETFEGILRDFADDWTVAFGADEESALIDAYAERIRRASDGRTCGLDVRDNGQRHGVDMAELEPCPFCGGEAKTAEYDTMYLHGFVVHCMNDDCPVAVGTHLCATEAEAAELWNTRAEKTCNVEHHTDGWGATTRHCGNCGADLDCDTRNKQNYCPVCGARLEVER
jgi:phosphoribosyl-ATP pyrophosphohydrolase